MHILRLRLRKETNNSAKSQSLARHKMSTGRCNEYNPYWQHVQPVVRFLQMAIILMAWAVALWMQIDMGLPTLATLCIQAEVMAPRGLEVTLASAHLVDTLV